MKTWNLRDEILDATHRWYVIIAFILAGSLIGWGASFIWPSPYRATLNLYVGLNAYRSPYDSHAASLAGQSFRMVDDYKNWQMEELHTLVLTDPYLEEVLMRLRAKDPYWQEITPQDLRQNMDVLWRNVGEWHLVVVEDSHQRVMQAVETWGTVILERVNEAIDHSKQVVALDIQMTTLAEGRMAYELRLDRLRYVQGQLSAMRKLLEAAPGDQAISSADHWNILALVSLVAEWNPVWDNLLDDAPTIGSTSQPYLEWLEGAQSLIDEGVTILPGQISKLKEQFLSAAEVYEIETKSSAGLASTLVIEGISGESPKVEAVTPDGTLSFVGGVIGFLAWGIWATTRINRKNPS